MGLANRKMMTAYALSISSAVVGGGGGRGHGQSMVMVCHGCGGGGWVDEHHSQCNNHERKTSIVFLLRRLSVCPISEGSTEAGVSLLNRNPTDDVRTDIFREITSKRRRTDNSLKSLLTTLDDGQFIDGQTIR